VSLKGKKYSGRRGKYFL